MKIWHSYPTLSAAMPFQMALDEVLFRGMIDGDIPQSPIFRFFFSSEPWASVGFSHRGEMAGDLPVCRRITGGGRVVHGEDLIFSVIGQKEDDESFKSVRVSYWKIHEAVKAGLEALGEKPRFYRCDEELPRGNDCFLYPIATDLALGSQKIAGGAQKRSSGIFLHQESLKLSGSEPEILMAALKEGFEKIFHVTFQNMPCHPEQFEKAKALAREKYHPDTQMKNRELVGSL